MSSTILAQTPQGKAGFTPQGSLVVKSNANSTLQWSKPTTAAPVSATPGTTTSINIKFNSRYPETEVSHYLEYDVQNTSASDAIFPRGAEDHFDQITVYPNDTNTGIELENLAQRRELVADAWLTKYGLDIYEGTSFDRDEFDTFNGITVPAGSTKKFYYNLEHIINFAKRQVQGQIRTLKIDLRVSPAPSNAQYAGRISVRSSTINPAYTEQTVTFKNIGYVRQYVIINNPVLSVPFIFNDKAPERHVNWKVYEKVLYRGPWNKSTSNS